MCSIIGYYGKNLAAPILVKGLQKMEYRGYDSVGVATKTDTEILVKKGVGKVVEVNTKVQLDNLPGMVGIGHTIHCQPMIHLIGIDLMVIAIFMEQCVKFL